MSGFLQRGLYVVGICLIIYLIFFVATACLDVVFPKLKPSKCPDYYEVDSSRCKLKDTSNMGLDPSFNSYFVNLKVKCNKEIVNPNDDGGYNPLDSDIGANLATKKILCRWAKKNTINNNDESNSKKLNSCFVPWDGLTNGLDKNGKPYCS